MGKAMKKLPEGLVIILEGIDGVGKTTQLGLAKDELAKRNRLIHATRNLGGTPVGEKLREVTLSAVERSATTDLYISVAIQTALAESIEAERALGKIVLVDRGPLSLASYHIYGNGVDAKLGWRYADEGMKRFKPDLVILYTADLKTALGRAKRRSGKIDYFASKPDAYFKRVIHGFQDATERYSPMIIDATQGIQAVHAQTMSAIGNLISKPNHKHR